jgi:hypothetical protein
MAGAGGSTPDAAPDLSPGAPPDVSLDLAPDVAPDVAPDTAPDVAPDVSTDTSTMPFVAFQACPTAQSYQALTQILFNASGFNPRCAKVSRFAHVTFTGDFGDHPLRPGRNTSGDPLGTPGNPITNVGPDNPPANATFIFNQPGFFPYHCDSHDSMRGVIWVTD